MIEIFCTIFYVCSYISTIPYIVKVWRTKSSNDYSLLGILIATIGNVSWCIYIVLTHASLLVLIETFADFILALILNVSVLFFYKWGNGKEEN
jgi:uncharacterized protein with PQ loop repeat